MTKKVCSLFITIGIMLMLLCAVNTVFASESGTCGENLTWTFDETSGTLTISGTGDMPDASDGRMWTVSWQKIKKVVIEEGVTSIGADAFNHYKALTEVEIAEGVTSIGERAFEACDGIKAIKIPESVREFGPCVFQQCDSLSEIELPDGLKIISTEMFWDCSSLKKVIIPDSVEEIRWGAFENCEKLEEAELPDGLTMIQASAFYGCGSLKRITIPDSVHTIGGSAFSGCYNITSLTVPGSVSLINESAFSYCLRLSELVISEGVKKIEMFAFSGCDSLESVRLPDSLTLIDDSAFKRCSALSSIEVGEGNKKYKSIDGVLYDKNVTAMIIYPRGRADEQYVIPDTVTELGEYRFSGCTGIKSVKIGKGITRIGADAFAGIGISEIEIPEWVETIGSGAFRHCYNLTSITIPDTVTCVWDSAFLDCVNLKTVTWGSGATTIPNCCFEYCENLESVVIATGVKAINYCAFAECLKLNDVQIPDTVNFVDIKAFDSTAYQIYDEYWENGVLYIGKYLIETKSSVGGEYKVKDGTLGIVGRAFESCDDLTKVEIPDSVVFIGDEAFCGSGVTDVTIGRGLTYVGEYAFASCDNLTRINVYADKNNVEVVNSATNEYTQKAIYIPNIKTVTLVGGKRIRALPINIESGKDVIVALYDGGRLVGMQRKTFAGSMLTFNIPEPYTDARVMVWEKLENCEPCCEPVEVKKAV